MSVGGGACGSESLRLWEGPRPQEPLWAAGGEAGHAGTACGPEAPLVALMLGGLEGQ